MGKKLRYEKRERFSSWFVCFVFIFLMGISISLSWSAEGTYPDRPINMVIPFAPGGGSDLGSRVVADKISEFLGQPLISVYKPGGGGSLGMSFLAKAKPDGYTVVAGTAGGIIALYPILGKADYKLDDFTILGMYGKVPHMLSVRADARWRTVRDFIEEGKKSAGALNVGTYGTLTQADFVIKLLNRHAGTKLKNIPFKSTGEAMTSLLGGHIDATITTSVGGHLESGKVRILAVAEEQRLDGLSDVPTLKELGYPIYAFIYYSFCSPKGTPDKVVDKFSKALEDAYKRYPNEIKEGLRRVEIWAEYRRPKDIREQYEKDYVFFRKLVDELGIVAK